MCVAHGLHDLTHSHHYSHFRVNGLRLFRFSIINSLHVSSFPSCLLYSCHTFPACGRFAHQPFSCSTMTPRVLVLNLPALGCGLTLDLETEIGKCLKEFRETWKQDCRSAHMATLLIDLAMKPKAAVCLLPVGWPSIQLLPIRLCIPSTLTEHVKTQIRNINLVPDVGVVDFDAKQQPEPVTFFDLACRLEMQVSELRVAYLKVCSLCFGSSWFRVPCLPV